MTNDSITADAVWSYIDSHRRVTGALPKLREVVEHFDGKLLNVMLCLSEMSDERSGMIRRMAREDAAESRRRKVRREPAA